MVFLLGMNPRRCDLEGECGFKIPVLDFVQCRPRSSEGVVRAQITGKCHYIPTAKKEDPKKIRLGQQKQKKAK